MREMLPTSKSSLKEISTCPFHWYGTHILKKRTAPGEAALIGLDVEMCWQRVLKDGISTEEALKELKYQDNAPQLLINALAITQVYPDCEHEFQANVLLDPSGYRTMTKDDAVFLAILDRIEYHTDHTVVQDLKTGQKYRDMDEVFGYAFAGRALNPFVDKVVFEYLWAKTCEVETFTFLFKGKNEVTMIDPEGNLNVFSNLWKDFADRCLSLEDIDPVPLPGDHCSNWYGQSCHLMKECPTMWQTSELVEISNPEIVGTTSLLLKALATGERVELGPAMASEALGCVLHAEAFLGKIKDRLQEYVKESGEPIVVGNMAYGYYPRESLEIDKAKALQAILESNMHYSEMAKIISIPGSNVKKITKAYADVKNYILENCAMPGKESEAWGKRKIS